MKRTTNTEKNEFVEDYIADEFPETFDCQYHPVYSSEVQTLIAALYDQLEDLKKHYKPANKEYLESTIAAVTEFWNSEIYAAIATHHRR